MPNTSATPAPAPVATEATVPAVVPAPAEATAPEATAPVAPEVLKTVREYDVLFDRVSVSNAKVAELVTDLLNAKNLTPGLVKTATALKVVCDAWKDAGKPEATEIITTDHGKIVNKSTRGQVAGYVASIVDLGARFAEITTAFEARMEVSLTRVSETTATSKPKTKNLLDNLE